MRCTELEPHGIDLVLVNRSIDEEVTSGAAWNESDCALLTEINAMGIDVMIAGGINAENLPMFCEVPLYAVVVGLGITAQKDPSAAAEHLYKVIQTKFR